MSSVICEGLLRSSDFGAADATLLAWHWQAALSSCPVPTQGDTETMQRYLRALEAGVHQSTMRSTMHLPASPQQIRRAIGSTAASIGLRGLVEEEEGALTATQLHVGGVLMGTVYMRDIKRVLFYMLMEANADNFCTEPAVRRAPDGSLLFTHKLTLASGGDICAEVEECARVAQSPTLQRLTVKGFLRVVPLLLVTGSDATARQTTTAEAWDALTLACAAPPHALTAAGRHQRQ